MNTDLIHQFCSVIESGTVAKAAEHLNMTPGALSRALKRLEIELDTNLFIPSGRNIIPTDTAKRFYPLGKEILQRLETSKTSLKSKLQATKPFKIATFEIFSSHFMAHFFAQEESAREYSLLEKTPGMIEEAIKLGLADAGITYVPFLSSELDHLVVGTMEFGIFSKQKNNSRELPFAVPVTDLGQNIMNAQSLDGWPKDSPRNIKYRFELLETAFDLASRGLCKICCPKFLIKIENERLKSSFQLVEDNFSKSVNLTPLKVYLVKRKSDSESQEIKRLTKCLRIALKN